MDEYQEHLKKMQDSFPDYPCVKCGMGMSGKCRAIDKCEMWKSWFKRHWNEICERLKKHE